MTTSTAEKPLSPVRWRDELPQWLLISGMFLVTALVWPWVPDKVPVHWNFQGEVDRVGSKWEGLLVIPCLSAGLYMLLLALPRIDPGRANYPSFHSAFVQIRLAILGMLATLDAALILTALGYSVSMSTLMPIAIGLLFIVLGNLMGKIRPNWFVGVRTPWTLSSRRSWNQTHRLAGWLFVVMGLFFLLCGLVHSGWLLAMCIATNIICVTWMVIYSYLVWRDDPERISPAATTPHNQDTPL